MDYHKVIFVELLEVHWTDFQPQTIFTLSQSNFDRTKQMFFFPLSKLNHLDGEWFYKFPMPEYSGDVWFNRSGQISSFPICVTVFIFSYIHRNAQRVRANKEEEDEEWIQFPYHLSYLFFFVSLKLLTSSITIKQYQIDERGRREDEHIERESLILQTFGCRPNGISHSGVKHELIPVQFDWLR